MDNEVQQCVECQNFEKSSSTCSITKLKVKKDSKFKCVLFKPKPTIPTLVETTKESEIQLNNTAPPISWLDETQQSHSVTGLKYKSDKLSMLDIENLKKYLQKREGVIEFSIDQEKAFQILIDQFKVFDLNEVQADKIHLTAIYSGFAPILNYDMIAELKINDKKADLIIWTKDSYQAFGVLSFLKNSLKILFDSSSKFEGKSDKIDQKINNLKEIIQILNEIYNCCEEVGKIKTCFNHLEKLRTIIMNSYPDMSFITEIQKWINELNDPEKIQIKDQEEKSIRFEYNLLYWIVELNTIVRYDYDAYREISPQEKTQELYNSIENLVTLFNQIETSYFKRIMQFLMVLIKGTGVTIYSFDFSSNMIEPNLISGFLTAIKMFGLELAEEESSTAKLEYKGLEIILEDEYKITGVLILKASPTDRLINLLKDFTREFWTKYENEIENFQGEISDFDKAIEIKNKVFG